MSGIRQLGNTPRASVNPGKECVGEKKKEKKKNLAISIIRGIEPTLPVSMAGVLEPLGGICTHYCYAGQSGYADAPTIGNNKIIAG